MVVLLCKALNHLGGQALLGEVGPWAVDPLPDPMKSEQDATTRAAHHFCDHTHPLPHHNGLFTLQL